MKIFWRNGEKECLLLCEPAAKLASIKLEDGKFRFTCLGVNEFLQVKTLVEAKRLAEVRMRTLLSNIQDSLRKGDVPSVC